LSTSYGVSLGGGAALAAAETVCAFRQRTQNCYVPLAAISV
jgi:hypothetical protein